MQQQQPRVTVVQAQAPPVYPPSSAPVYQQDHDFHPEVLPGQVRPL